MSESEPVPTPEKQEAPKGLGDLLSNFALGPAWARGDSGRSKPQAIQDRGARQHPDQESRRGDSRGNARGADRRHDRDGGRRFQNERGGDDSKRGFQRPEHAPPAAGVRLSLVPDAAALHLIAKEVHQVARVYSLFDIATTLLASRERCRVVFEIDEGQSPFHVGRRDVSLFLTRAEAAAHLWRNRALRDEYLHEETVEVDPPNGSFVAIARCGMSGEWLGPPNFHTYQTNLRRMHRERFSEMPFEAYCAKVRTERGEEAVNAWLDSMKTRIRWRLKSAGDDASWIMDVGEAMKALESSCFDEAFETTRIANVPASIAAANLSPGLLSTLKLTGGHIRKHPAMMIPAICKALEAEHLPVFKRKGKLFTGPARPLALPQDAVLAERPARMVEWIRANTPAKLEGLWRAVLPEGGTAPPAEYAADLFWMLQQGHVLLFTDDTLMVQEPQDPGTAAKQFPSQKKAKKNKAKPAAASPQAGESHPQPPADEPGNVDVADETVNPADAAAEPAGEWSQPPSEGPVGSPPEESGDPVRD